MQKEAASMQTSGNKAQITVLVCVSAAGVTISPMVIFDRAVLRQDLTEGEVPNTIYGLTNNVWSNAEMFNIISFFTLLQQLGPYCC